MATRERIFPVRVRKRGRGRGIALPPEVCAHLGVCVEDLVDWLITEDGQVLLQVHPGASEKDLLLRGQTFALQRIELAAAEGERKREAGYQEGYFRRASEDLFRPPSPLVRIPPRGRRGRG